MRHANPDRPTAFLDTTARVPLDRPFTSSEARDAGVPWRQLQRWRAAGLVVAPLQGVYHVAQLPDGLDLRVACLRLVAPSDAVIADETAAWLHGATMALAPGDHLTTPRVSMFLPPGRRLRNEVTASGERTFLSGEVVDLDGVRVTSPVRTMCDLGRKRDSDRSFAAMEALANLAVVDLEEFRSTALGSRFRGYRWVRGLRAWAPHVRRGVQSGPESVLRKRWIQCSSLPYPEPQVAVPGPRGVFYLDMANEDLRYGAEYDGEAWHGPDRREHDEARRGWLDREGGWVVDVFTRGDVFGPTQNVEARLHDGVTRARRRRGSQAWRGQGRDPVTGRRTGA